ncbi:MAG: anaerobic ribonucleoside-triphosphate reductase activating protein [Bacteroidales bacterium]
MNYHALFKNDMVNGEGVRVTLFVGGCIHACKGCYNQSTWNPDNGTPFTDETTNSIIEALRPSYIAGLSLSGGDPLFPGNLHDILKLILIVRKEFGDTKNIWLWSGFTLNEIIGGPEEIDWVLRREIIENIDVLIDGKFEEDKHEHGLLFRGSTNQVIHRMKRNGTKVS